MEVGDSCLELLIEEGRQLNQALERDLEDAKAGFAEAEEQVFDFDCVPLAFPVGQSKTRELGSEAGSATGCWRQRTPLIPARITGRLQEVRGKFGWIWPDKPIDHPNAGMHDGKIYLSHRDVEAEISGVGSHVSFLLYADGSGLGAMNCRPTGADAQRGDVPAGGVVGQWAVPALPSSIPRLHPGPSVGLTPAPAPAAHMPCNRTPTMRLPARPATVPVNTATEARRPDVYVQRQDNPTPAVREMPTPAVRVPPKRPHPEAKSKGRTRVSDVPVAGHVRTWKGSYGWVEPVEAIRHPMFNGKVFLHLNDFKSSDPPEVGTKVVFLIYSDPDGLGAEHCTLAHSASSSAPAAAEEASASFPHTSVGHGALRFNSPQPPPTVGAQSQPLGQPPVIATATGPPGAPVVETALSLPSAVGDDMAKRLAAWMENMGG